MLDRAREKVVLRDGLHVSDIARGKAVGGQRHDITDSARGKMVVRENVILETVKGAKGS